MYLDDDSLLALLWKQKGHMQEHREGEPPTPTCDHHGNPHQLLKKNDVGDSRGLRMIYQDSPPENNSTMTCLDNVAKNLGIAKFINTLKILQTKDTWLDIANRLRDIPKIIEIIHNALVLSCPRPLKNLRFFEPSEAGGSSSAAADRVVSHGRLLKSGWLEIPILID